MSQLGRDDVHGILRYLLSRAQASLYLNMLGFDDEELNAECMRCALDSSITTVITLDKSGAYFATKQGERAMAKFTWDHIHLRTTDPEAMAQWFEKTLGAEVLRTMQQGKPRIDLKIGGANIFIAPVAPGDRVNAAPTTPYRGLDHFGLAVTGIDAIAADLKANGVEFTREPTTVRPGVRVCFIRAPEGVSIELLDRSAK